MVPLKNSIMSHTSMVFGDDVGEGELLSLRLTGTGVGEGEVLSLHSREPSVMMPAPLVALTPPLSTTTLRP
jgi:hypothetical protein